MKITFALVLFFTLTVIGFGESPAPVQSPTETIMTTKGERFEQARVTAVTPATLTITHSFGVATIPLADFPPEIQKQYGYDPAKAKAYMDQLTVQLRQQYEAQLAAQRATDQQAKDQAYRRKRRAAENDEAVSRLAHFFHEGGQFIYDPATKRVYFSEAEAAAAREAALRMAEEARRQEKY